MTRAPAHPGRHGRGGFTLIEALMAIFILAIGFLSLAAIFPAGIELQRRGSDDLEGVTAANEIYGRLLTHPMLASDRLNEGFTSMIRETDPPDVWMPDYSVTSVNMKDPVRGVGRLGTLRMYTRATPGNPLQEVADSDLLLNQGQRLWPSIEAPRMIWDLLIRRPESTDIPTALTASRHMAGDVQLALILRRVDPEFARIVSETQDLDPYDLPRPVIAKPSGSTLQYSAPMMPDLPNVIEYDPARPAGQKFRWTGMGRDADAMLAALREPRQWLLDSDGNAWKIARIRDVDNSTYLEFAPEPTEAQALRFNDMDALPTVKALRFVYFDTPPVLIDVRTFKSGAGL